MTAFEDIKGVGAPARRALVDAGYPNLESLDGVHWGEALSLHGVGKRGLERLQAALADKGLSMKDAPEPEGREPTFTRGATGNSENKTAPTDVDPSEYIDGLEGRRREHGHVRLEVFGKATGADPVMWGPSMIGYGEVHYKYATGREGDMFAVGFSPRKAKISLYGIEPTEKLGKYTQGASCVYVNKPEDIDLDVLEQLVAETWRQWQ